MKTLLISLIRLYQKTLSPDHGPLRSFFPPGGNIVCRYHPTCSEYMEETINKYGVFKGFFWGLKRILRCHPWSHHPTHDPVV